MQVNSPLRGCVPPLKRVGPRGSGQFEEISWDEALDIATGWLKPIASEDPSQACLFHRAGSVQSFTGFWAQNFGTPNYRRPWRVSVRSTWRPLASTRWAARSGNSGAGLGAYEAFHDFRRGRGP
jgi:anaerobic selenocysteine-containing dehydrogenase